MDAEIRSIGIEVAEGLHRDSGIRDSPSPAGVETSEQVFGGWRLKGCVRSDAEKKQPAAVMAVVGA